ncbi:DUF5367 family protein [Evansella halocellulosilytica]|uniref:DUF5367 family protein n=1 Tax=Evansella halocellulosilytica TaxID=2011013 RepID=UPI000BB7ECCB|nr:DUF5367 family protein [Evansella halocellulosilytica]
MTGYTFTVVFGILVWFIATMFFIVFGEYVLFSPGSINYGISLSLLIVGTGILLWGVTYLYLFFDKSVYAPLKFGVIGTTIGLALDTFSISFHNVLFPHLDDSQVIAFTAWMSFAYALYLLIPAIINVKRSSLQ